MSLEKTRRHLPTIEFRCCHKKAIVLIENIMAQELQLCISFLKEFISDRSIGNDCIEL